MLRLEPADLRDRRGEVAVAQWRTVRQQHVAGLDAGELLGQSFLSLTHEVTVVAELHRPGRAVEAEASVTLVPPATDPVPVASRQDLGISEIEVRRRQTLA